MACLGSETEDLSLQGVLTYFRKQTGDVDLSLPPVKPKGGEVYLFSSGNDSLKKG